MDSTSIRDLVTVKVTKVSAIPAAAPAGFLVCFLITLKSNGSMVYKDAFVSFDSAYGKSTPEVVELAWFAILYDLTRWIDSAKNLPAIPDIVGLDFVVPDTPMPAAMPVTEPVPSLGMTGAATEPAPSS
jgi:hypothetical protein